MVVIRKKVMSGERAGPLGLCLHVGKLMDLSLLSPQVGF